MPDVVGLNDIDVPSFARENALMNITQYVNALPYKSSLSPGHLQLATNAGKYYGVPYLADLSVLWYNKTLFKQAGPQGYEMVASVLGSRRRVAAAFGVAERAVPQEFGRRMANPQKVVEVPSGDAPVHQVVKTGAEIDLTMLAEIGQTVERLRSWQHHRVAKMPARRRVSENMRQEDALVHLESVFVLE